MHEYQERLPPPLPSFAPVNTPGIRSAHRQLLNVIGDYSRFRLFDTVCSVVDSLWRLTWISG